MGGGSPGGLRPRPAPSPTCSSPAFTSVARPSLSWRACSHAAAPTSLRGTSRRRSPPARTRSSCPRTTVRASSTSFATRPRSSPSSTPHCSPSTATQPAACRPRARRVGGGPEPRNCAGRAGCSRGSTISNPAHENLEVRPRRGRDVRLVRSGGVVVGLGADDRRTGVPGEDCGFDFRLRVSGQRGLTRTAATGASTRAARPLVLNRRDRERGVDEHDPTSPVRGLDVGVVGAVVRATGLRPHDGRFRHLRERSGLHLRRDVRGERLARLPRLGRPRGVRGRGRAPRTTFRCRLRRRWPRRRDRVLRAQPGSWRSSEPCRASLLPPDRLTCTMVGPGVGDGPGSG